MSRYADIDAIMADIDKRFCKPCKDCKDDYNGVRCRACWVNDTIDVIESYEDATIEIVFCRDCRYMMTETSDEGTSYYWCTNARVGLAVDEWNYCCWGERSTDD